MAFPVEIIALDKVFYQGPFKMLVVPAMDGEMGIMPHRQPVVAAIQAGELRLITEEEGELLAAVGDGLMEVSEHKVRVLVDFAERADEIDEIRAQEQKERAEDEIRAKRDARAVAHAEAALSRALARLRTKRDYLSR